MKYLKNNKLIIIIIVYLLITINFTINNVSIFNNIINPLFWGIMIIYLIFELKKNNIKFSTNKNYLKFIVIITFICVIVYLGLGSIIGFVRNPYSQRIGAIVKNIFIQIIPIVGIEISRCIILNKNKDSKIKIVAITVLLILLEINYNAIINIYSNKREMFEYISETIFPLIMNNFLCTYLTLKGSYSFSLIYKIFIQLNILLLPILTNANWFVSGSIGVILPTLIYLLFEYIFLKEKRNVLVEIIETVTVTSCALLICFMLGAFRYEPITILSNSMKPTFSRGDAIIYKKLNEEELKKIPKNSIIVYTIDNKNIAHRVVDVINEKENVQYKTKGDNNNVADINLVQINQIKGIYVFNIKYLGFPSVWLYEYFNS